MKDLIKGLDVYGELLGIRGHWKGELIREGKVIETYDFYNTIVNEGKNLLLNIMFGATAKIATWYMGLIDNAAFTIISNTDTAASHAGWAEYTANSDATRGTWGAGTASSQTITNAAAVVFNFTATATINGIFISTVNTKGSSTGTLWSAASFASTVGVVNGDQLKMTYTLSM